MKIWSMPDCGQKTGVILQKLKRVAGIQDTVPKPHNRKPSKPMTVFSCSIHVHVYGWLIHFLRVLKFHEQLLSAITLPS